MAERAAIYRRRRDFVVDALNACPGITCHRPEGAFYVFPNIAGCLGKTTAGGRHAEAPTRISAWRCWRSSYVAMVHGAAFGMSPYLRISYATDDAALAKGMRAHRGVYPRAASDGAASAPGRDDDAAGFIDLIGGCWAEYPGCVMDLDGEVPELRALASYYAGQGGALWAAEAAGPSRRHGRHPAARPTARGKSARCMSPAPQRGTGLAQALLEAAEDHARAAGGARA